MKRLWRWRAGSRGGQKGVSNAPPAGDDAVLSELDDSVLHAAAQGRGISAAFSDRPLADDFDERLWQADAAAARYWLAAFVDAANLRRDRGRVDAAAAAYGAALRLAPWRTDLKVQRGNMLKDAGVLPEAERQYREALLDSPQDGDIHLQLGHVLKLMGRRPAALAQYEIAFALEGAAAEAAHLELVQAGETARQREALRARIAAHGVESWMQAAARLEEVKALLFDVTESLPALRTFAGIPADDYAQYRRLIPIPAVELPPARMIWVLMDFEAVPPDVVHAQLRGLRLQSYPHWRLLVSGVSPDAAAALARLALDDDRLAPSSPWPESLADGLILSVGRGAVLHSDALGWFASVAASSGAELLFCDEAVLPSRPSTGARLVARWTFDPEAALQRDVVGDSFAVLASCYSRLGAAPAARMRPISGLMAGLAAVEQGWRVRHVALALVERVMPNTVSQEAVVAHAASVRRLLSKPRRLAAFSAARQPAATVQDVGHDASEGVRLVWHGDPTEAITVVVATRDNAADCVRFVDSLFACAVRPDLLTCVICDNGTQEPEDVAALRALAARADISVLRLDVAFNWSWLNNHAASACTAPLLLFANDDMEMLTRGWDDLLRGQLARPHVGAVGAKLLYPDETIQHAGILFGWQGSVIHDGLHAPRHAPDQDRRWQTTRRVCAVTGAFLAVRRTVFERVGGFDAREMPVAYSDVDLALRLAEIGCVVLYCPEIELLHMESKSRGYDHLDPERQARALDERTAIERRWGAQTFAADPTVNPVWLDATLPFRLLRPVPTAEIVVPPAWPVAYGRPNGDVA